MGLKTERWQAPALDLSRVACSAPLPCRSELAVSAFQAVLDCSGDELPRRPKSKNDSAERTAGMGSDFQAEHPGAGVSGTAKVKVGQCRQPRASSSRTVLGILGIYLPGGGNGRGRDKVLPVFHEAASMI